MTTYVLTPRILSIKSKIKEAMKSHSLKNKERIIALLTAMLIKEETSSPTK